MKKATEEKNEKSTPWVVIQSGGIVRKMMDTVVSFGDRVTYTFAALHKTGEIGVIHFDKLRKEIFYKGHNIKNLELESWQEKVLEDFSLILKKDSKHKSFAQAYSQTLEKVFLEKRRQSSLI